MVNVGAIKTLKADMGSITVPNADVASIMLINADMGPRVFPSDDVASLMLLWLDMGPWGLLGQRRELWSSPKASTLPKDLDNMTISGSPQIGITQNNTRLKLNKKRRPITGLTMGFVDQCLLFY